MDSPPRRYCHKLSLWLQLENVSFRCGKTRDKLNTYLSKVHKSRNKEKLKSKSNEIIDF